MIIDHPPTDKNITTLINAIKGEKKSKHDIKKDSIKPFNGKRSINELKILLKTLDNDKIEMLELNIINNIKKRLLSLPRIKEKSVRISSPGKMTLLEMQTL